ncbi:unnamed protein product, partial [Brachionus calyciflorus]
EEQANSLDIKLNVEWEHEQNNDRDLALVKKAFRSRDEEFVIARPVSGYTAEITIRFLKEDNINKFGVPLAWLTDKGRNFEAQIFAEFCSTYNIKKLRTTGYHPQCNGLVERTIKTIKQMLSTFVNSQHDNWDEVLSDFVFAYNNNVHSSTNFAPNEVVFKKILPSSQDRGLEIETPEIKIDENQLVKEIDQNLEKAQSNQKKQFDKIRRMKYALTEKPIDIIGVVTPQEIEYLEEVKRKMERKEEKAEDDEDEEGYKPIVYFIEKFKQKIPTTTMSDILKYKNSFLNSESINSLRIRNSKYPKLEDALFLWFNDKRCLGLPISDDILVLKAHDFVM